MVLPRHHTSGAPLAPEACSRGFLSCCARARLLTTPSGVSLGPSGSPMSIATILRWVRPTSASNAGVMAHLVLWTLTTASTCVVLVVFIVCEAAQSSALRSAQHVVRIRRPPRQPSGCPGRGGQVPRVHFRRWIVKRVVEGGFAKRSSCRHDHARRLENT